MDLFKYECIIDTSAISWMERIGKLDLLSQIYTGIYAPQGVLEQLKSHRPTLNFVKSYVKPVYFRNDKERKNFEKLIKRWSKKVELDDIVDLQVFISYKFFTNTNEVLYANKGAEENFSRYLESNEKIRDICQLYEIAEEKSIFTRDDSIAYLEAFLRIDRPYRPPLVKRLLSQLRHS